MVLRASKFAHKKDSITESFLFFIYFYEWRDYR